VTLLLDTCFVSELTRRERDAGVIAWLEAQDEEGLSLCEVTVGEIEKGLAKLRYAARRKRLRTLLEAEIIERFRRRILAVDGAVWRRWGALCGAAERTGRALPVLDALVASVAQVHGLTVVTRNEADFTRCEISVVNPWSG
jgi:predicted nucleic acid-binding protein